MGKSLNMYEAHKQNPKDFLIVFGFGSWSQKEFDFLAFDVVSIVY